MPARIIDIHQHLCILGGAAGDARSAEALRGEATIDRDHLRIRAPPSAPPVRGEWLNCSSTAVRRGGMARLAGDEGGGAHAQKRDGARGVGGLAQPAERRRLDRLPHVAPACAPSRLARARGGRLTGASAEGLSLTAASSMGVRVIQGQTQLTRMSSGAHSHASASDMCAIAALLIAYGTPVPVERTPAALATLTTLARPVERRNSGRHSCAWRYIAVSTRRCDGPGVRGSPGT